LTVPADEPNEFDAAVAITLRTTPGETPTCASVLPAVADREARMAAFKIHLSQWLGGVGADEPGSGEHLH
jgi:hypothetical protein